MKDKFKERAKYTRVQEEEREWRVNVLFFVLFLAKIETACSVMLELTA